MKLIINNSYSRVLDININDFNELRTLLSYLPDNKANYFSRGYNYRRYLIDKRGYFPTGLLHKVATFLTDKQVIVQDMRIKPKSTKNMFCLNSIHKPYPWQIAAAEKMAKTHRGGIIAATGTGKSFLIALIASRLNVKTLVVVPTLEIKSQLIEAFSVILKGSDKNLIVENIGSTKLKHLTDFDCLIVDECHHAAAKTYRILNKTAWNKAYYRFFVTATFFRNNEDENMLFEGVCGQPIYKLDYRSAIRNNYIVPVEAYYYDLPKQPVTGYTYNEVYQEAVVNNAIRNDIIVNTMESLQNCNILCLVSRIDHGKILSKMSGVPFVSGEDDESRKYIQMFNKGEIKSLIGTTGVLGEGIDTRPAEYILIAGLGKAKSAFQQQIGRGVRKYKDKKSCKIILFRDRSHKFLLRHYREQCKVLKETYGVVPINLEE